MADLGLLDQSVAKLLEAAKDLPAEDIEQLITAETDGKTRAGAIAGLTALLPEPEGVVEGEEVLEPSEDASDMGEVPEEAPEAIPEDGNTVTNCLKGTTLHLGDGRRLEFGESAPVSAELAEQLRESGRAQ